MNKPLWYFFSIQISIMTHMKIILLVRQTLNTSHVNYGILVNKDSLNDQIGAFLQLNSEYI